MWVISKMAVVLMWCSIAMLVLGSAGALIHSLESKRIGWFLSFFCIPGSTLLYAMLYKGEARPQWVLTKCGLFGLCGVIVLALIAALLSGASPHAPGR